MLKEERYTETIYKIIININSKDKHFDDLKVIFKTK